MLILIAMLPYIAKGLIIKVMDLDMGETGLPRWGSGKEPACQFRRCRGHSFPPWVRKIPWRRKWQPDPVFLTEKFHDQRSLVGYSPWHHKGSDTTEQLSTHTHIHTHIWGDYSVSSEKPKFNYKSLKAENFFRL